MINPNEQEQSGYLSNGYSFDSDRQDFHTDQAKSNEDALGAGNTVWRTDQVSDGYRENVFEVNFADTPYTESLNNPNPQTEGYAVQQSQPAPNSLHSTTDGELEL